MYLLPLLFSNLHLGLNAPLDPLDSSVGFRTNLPQPEELVPRIFDRYYPVTYDRGVLDFFNPRTDFIPWTFYPGLLNSRHYIDNTVTIDNDNFKMTINVQQYKPEEVTVKVVDRWLIIEGKQEEKKGDSFIASRQFVRRYLLPSRVDVDQVTSSISSEGILTITAPLKPEEEKEIKIEQTGQPANPSKDEKEAGTSETNVDKKVENNEVREEVTATQAQEEGPKPEKR